MPFEMKTVYVFNGNDYHDLEDIECVLTNNIGGIIDQMCNNGLFGPKHRLVIFDFLLNNPKGMHHVLGDLIDFEAFTASVKAAEEKS